MFAGSLDQVRELSQLVFGQRYRIEVMVAVASAPDGRVCLSDLSKKLEVAASNLQRPISDLVRAGLLSPLPADESRRRYYERKESLAWAFAVELSAFGGSDA